MYKKKKKIAICLIVCLCIIFNVVGIFAANNIDNPSVTSPPFRAQLVYSNQDSEYGDQVIAQVGGITGTYEAVIPLTIGAITNDKYIIGISTYTMSAAFSGYEDFIIESVNIWYEASDIESIYSTVNKTTASVIGTSSRLVIGWENYHTVGSSFAIGNLHMTISGRISNSTVRSVPRYIDCNLSIVSQANFLYAENSPQDTSLAAIIKQAILNALEDTSLGTNDVSVVEYLNMYLQYLYNTMTDVGAIRTEFTGFTDQLFDNFLQGIANNQGYIYDRLEIILSELTAFKNNELNNDTVMKGQFQTIIDKLSVIIDMNTAQAAQASAIAQEQNAIASQERQISDGLNVNKPDLNNVDFNIMDDLDNNTLQGFGNIVGLILSNNFIIKLGIIFLTCAIAGYALFGKKG